MDRKEQDMQLQDNGKNKPGMRKTCYLDVANEDLHMGECDIKDKFILGLKEIYIYIHSESAIS